MSAYHDLKFCIDCVHGGGPERLNTVHCRRRQTAQTVNHRADLVTGEVIEVGELLVCRAERRRLTWWERLTRIDRCGTEGRYFERAKQDGDA